MCRKSISIQFLEIQHVTKNVRGFSTRWSYRAPEDYSESSLLFVYTYIGSSYGNRFQRLGDLDDLENAIEYQSRALALTPEDQPDFPFLLDILVASHIDRFEHLGEIEDLEKRIEYQSRALDLTPEGHPILTYRHFTQAETFFLQYQHTSELSHLQDCLESFRKAARSLIGAPRDKFQYALRWANHAVDHSSLNSMEAYQTAIDLLPQFIWLGATTNQRYQDLSMTENLAVSAASAAILHSEYRLALEWLEHARCVVWNQNLMLRSPLDQLKSSHPSLGDHLQDVSNQLHAVSESRASQELLSNVVTPEEAARKHHRLAQEYSELMSEVRKLPGFEDFLQPMKTGSLTRAARNGPVVVINCSNTRCDALIILPGRDEVELVSLPDFSHEEAQRARTEMQSSLKCQGIRERGAQLDQDRGGDACFEDVLKMLWDSVVKPILDFLGYTRTAPTGDLPHITWCPTGAVSFLPLHAAGDYDQPHSRVFDYAISSYTPTLNALLSSAPSPLSPGSRVLGIGQETTFAPGYRLSKLPGTTKELLLMKKHAEEAKNIGFSKLTGDKATATAVLDAMEQHDWVHLACHAHQNVKDATASGFFLHDGILDLASINRRSFKNKGLAFLSACQTAMGDEKLPDEAVHLASGMLMAGYSSVIATMWSVVDEDAPFVADRVYADLMKNGKLGNGEAGRALHYAVAELREKVEEKEFGRWVPYIHIGS